MAGLTRSRSLLFLTMHSDCQTKNLSDRNSSCSDLEELIFEFTCLKRYFRWIGMLSRTPMGSVRILADSYLELRNNVVSISRHEIDTTQLI
jgi:hypothetical protein